MSTQENHTNPTHTGKCLCEGVTFTVKGQPNTVYCCYCKDCSLGAGGPCQITASYFSSQFILHDPDGLARKFAITTGTVSGKPKDKFFCKRCGCTLFTIPFTHGPKEVVIRPALIENGLHMFKPSVECFSERRPRYFSACQSAAQRDTS